MVRASPEFNIVFLGRIALKADVQLLREQMERFGEVREAHMPLTDGVHRGFGFVTFDTATAALAAIDEGTVNLLLGRDALSRRRSREEQPKRNPAVGDKACSQICDKRDGDPMSRARSMHSESLTT